MRSNTGGYMVRDKDTERGYHSLKLRQGEVNWKKLFGVSIIRLMRHLMIPEGAKFKRNRKKHRN